MSLAIIFGQFDFFFVLAVLAIAPGDEDAIRCKVVALIKDDKIDEALSLIQSSQRPAVDFSFFKVHNFGSLFYCSG